MVHSRKFFCDLWDEKDSETDSNVYFPKNDAGFGDDDDSIAESDDDADAVVLTTLMTIKHLWTGVAYERQVSVLTKGVAHAQRLGDHLATEGGYQPTHLSAYLPTYLPICLWKLYSTLSRYIFRSPPESGMANKSASLQ